MNLQTIAKTVALAGFALIAGFVACQRPMAPAPAAPKSNASLAVEDIPTDSDYPADSNVLIGMIDQGDRRAMREHAWHLWAGLTAPSREVVDGQPIPVFETWYSIPEVFDDFYRNNPDARRRISHPTELPRQSFHIRNLTGENRISPVMSFVKFNRSAAQFIWDKKYYERKTLDDLNKSFDGGDTPNERREISPFPKESVALKVVFWLIKNGSSPQSQSGLTALPYWDPAYSPPLNNDLPTHDSWSKCVAVDPEQRYASGSIATINCNGNSIQAEVMHLDRFYSYKLASAEDVDDASRFLKMVSGASGKEERMVSNDGQTPELGDHIVLTAMHVTTKEMDNWTFQTFWWTPFPDLSPGGDFRTDNVRGQFRNYQMCTAYDMVTPRAADGSPAICFNPYLETDLGPTKSYVLGDQTFPPDPMAGTRSNCMTCHARAGYPAFGEPGSKSANFGRVFNEGYIRPDDHIFDGLTKTDFLWSIALQAQPRPPK